MNESEKYLLRFLGLIKKRVILIWVKVLVLRFSQKGGDFFGSKPLLIDVFGPDLLENNHNERI